MCIHIYIYNQIYLRLFVPQSNDFTQSFQSQFALLYFKSRKKNGTKFSPRWSIENYAWYQRNNDMFLARLSLLKETNQRSIRLRFTLGARTIPRHCENQRRARTSWITNDRNDNWFCVPCRIMLYTIGDPSYPVLACRRYPLERMP